MATKSPKPRWGEDFRRIDHPFLSVYLMTGRESFGTQLPRGLPHHLISFHDSTKCAMKRGLDGRKPGRWIELAPSRGRNAPNL